MEGFWTAGQKVLSHEIQRAWDAWLLALETCTLRFAVCVWPG